MVEGAILLMAMTMTTAKGEEDTQGSEKGTGNEKGTKNATGKRKGKGKGKGKGNGKGKRNGKGTGIVEQSPEGDDISRAIALQLKKEMYEADLDTEG